MNIPQDPNVCYNLALDYLHGRNGKAKNEFAACYLLEHLATDEKDYHKAQRQIGNFYYKGYGCIFKQNTQRAIRYMTKAAIGNDPLAIKFMNLHEIDNPRWLQKALTCKYITCDEFMSYLSMYKRRPRLRINANNNTDLYMQKVAAYQNEMNASAASSS